jgi:hypothetical protein
LRLLGEEAQHTAAVEWTRGHGPITREILPFAKCRCRPYRETKGAHGLCRGPLWNIEPLPTVAQLPLYQ